jgi:hypothetical protein
MIGLKGIEEKIGEPAGEFFVATTWHARPKSKKQGHKNRLERQQEEEAERRGLRTHLQVFVRGEVHSTANAASSSAPRK